MSDLNQNDQLFQGVYQDTPQQSGIPSANRRMNAILIGQVARILVSVFRKEKNIFDAMKILRSLGIDISYSYIVKPMLIGDIRIPGLTGYVRFGNTLLAILVKTGMEILVDQTIKDSGKSMQTHLVETSMQQGLVFVTNRILESLKPSAQGNRLGI
jgi:hypothetical protein